MANKQPTNREILDAVTDIKVTVNDNAEKISDLRQSVDENSQGLSDLRQSVSKISSKTSSLTRLVKENSQNIDLLGKQTHHLQPHVRNDACYYLGLSGNPAAIEYISPLLDDENAEVREVAEEALAELKLN